MIVAKSNAIFSDIIIIIIIIKRDFRKRSLQEQPLSAVQATIEKYLLNTTITFTIKKHLNTTNTFTIIKVHKILHFKKQPYEKRKIIKHEQGKSSCSTIIVLSCWQAYNKIKIQNKIVKFNNMANNSIKRVNHNSP